MKIEVTYETTSFEINEITVDINNIDELPILNETNFLKFIAVHFRKNK